MHLQHTSSDIPPGLDLKSCQSARECAVRLTAAGDLPSEAVAEAEAVSPEIAALTENCVGTWDTPVGVAEHFVVNGRRLRVYMAATEPTVVAGAASAAKACGWHDSQGFEVTVGKNLASCQVVFGFDSVDEAAEANRAFTRLLPRLRAEMRRHDTMLKHGGGITRIISETDRYDVVLTLTANVAQAMGANAVTSMGEKLADLLERETGARRLMSVVTNGRQGMRIEARAEWPVRKIGADTVERIMRLQRFAERNDDRATTHHKGILNGICAVGKATGQDVEAICASAVMTPLTPTLTTYSLGKQFLRGELRMTVPLGIVGGATGHPGAVRYLRAMDVRNVKQLAEIMGAVGLASNFAALRCLVTDGLTAARRRVRR